MSSSDEDWFNQDEDKLLQGLEKTLKSQELRANEEHIESCPPEVGGHYLKQLSLEASSVSAGSDGKASGRFSLTELTKALKMPAVDMFLYFLSEDRDLFVNQVLANDSVKRVGLFVDVLWSLCELELGGFDEIFLSAFSRQTVLLDKIKNLLQAKAAVAKCDADSALILSHIKWMLLRAHKHGVLSRQGYELVELYKKLAPSFKSDLIEDLEALSGNFSHNVKGQIYPTLDKLVGKEDTNASNDEENELLVSNKVVQYLNAQRNLLKDDFLEPLMEFVQQLRSETDVDEFKQQGLVWFNAHLTLNPQFAEAQRHSLVFLKVKSTEASKNDYKIWLQSIKSGTLLCLTTSLAFDDLILASVGYTEPEKLKEDCLSVQIVKQYNIGNIYDRPLIMFQAPVFFEPYLRVHNYLSTCSTEQFPMRRYIVDGELEIPPPAYMKPEFKLSYNTKPFTLDKLPDDLPFNESQKTAFKEALTREFSIIQGPPGTGKTHLSVELVNTLIQNAKALGTGPIIVLTYTNNSLDKFLVKVSQYTQEILRFGSQSRDPQISKFNVRTMINPDLVPPRLKRIWWLVNCEYKEKFQNLQGLYANFDGSEDSYQQTLAAQEQLNQVAERIDTLRMIFQFFLARDKDVLAMTTTCAARLNFLFRLLQSKCVVFEEAAEIQEAHILACLTPHTQHVILVGDHKQLQPFTGSSKVPQISLFERLIVAGLPFSLLNLQYRMRPCISDLLVPSIYDELLCSESVKEYENIRLMAKNLYFVQHNQTEQRTTDMSIENLYEAGVLAKLTEFLIQKAKYKHSDIAILSPYNAQIECIKQALPRKYRSSVQVASVDSFQGLEANIVLLSLVRSNPSGQIGFLRLANRVCVALSRARWALYIVGNLEMLQQSYPKLWSPIAQRLEENNAIGEAFPIST
ncbi:NFX1-type zinc finger-containing protein 1 isoform X1 [Drosophila teissieri]|uniref:NFX1-type zinc finger-containing protein 1 isoform X1 n=1 Tax=Drosophila teissieri TaxID=7243 RepID=UPI001CBA15F2|nr:NFX1-type zinc finger-containing protein 1 isoform X1 [Drosophila teissieri]